MAFPSSLTMKGIIPQGKPWTETGKNEIQTGLLCKKYKKQLKILTPYPKDCK